MRSAELGGTGTMRQTGEPTVEEILESIKKVIARDNRSLADDRVRDRLIPAETARQDHAPDEDVLDLGAEAELADENSEDRAADRDSPLLGEGVRMSMRESLAALAVLSEPGVPPQIVRSGALHVDSVRPEPASDRSRLHPGRPNHVPRPDQV